MGFLVSQDGDWYFVVSEIANIQIEKGRLDLLENGATKCINIWNVIIGCKDSKRYPVGMFYIRENATEAVRGIVKAMDSSGDFAIPKDERKD